jgi:hypothetical protein
MRWHKSPSWFFTGRHLFTCTAVSVLLALGAQAAAAKECRRETPLPADMRLIPAGSDVPETVARFAGAWAGAWKTPTGADALCHTLLVEEVLANGFARVIYSHGTDEGSKILLPQFWRATGRIVDGVLRFQLPTSDRPAFVYRFGGGMLSGTFKGEGNASLARVADVDQLDCRPRIGLPSPPPAAGPRDAVTAPELLAPGFTAAQPVHNDYFMPVGPSAPARHAFRGTVTFGVAPISSASQRCPGLATTPPGFTASFFTHGEHLVPVVRNILDPPGTLILSPGRVWSEPGDGGMSRASFPFVSVTQYTNETHNGLVTFLYDDTRVSALRFQIVQETAQWAKFDFWGQAPITYAPGPVANEAALRARFAAELSREAPIRPWSALPASARAWAFDGFDGDAALEDISANGLVVDGVVYVKGCNTRYGPYPYCRHMRHGVFSVTKSVGAAVALLRLAQKYGDAVFDLKLKDYVAVTASHDGWAEVTFADALNMATGNGDNAPQREPNDPFADENKPRMFEWINARTARAKLDVSFAYAKYPWAHGEVLRYNSTQTFVLAAAMDAFLKQKAGPSAHLWDMVTSEVLEPIGVFHAPMMHTVEAGGGRGIPLLAFGLYPTVDDVAKLTTLLQNGGQYQGQQVLSASRLAAALYKSGSMGLPPGWKNRFGDARYHLSFWSVPYRTDNGCFVQIPYMWGYGGNFVVLLPNGVSAFRFADGNNLDLESMILAGEAIRPFCASAPPAGPSPLQRSPLTASELGAELPGNTFHVGRSHIFQAPGGRLYSAGGDDMDVGWWRITPDGSYCRAWNVRDGRRERCYAVYRDGETFALHERDRWGTVSLRRTAGNPERY